MALGSSYWNAGTVVSEIRRRQRADRPVTATGVRKGPDGDWALHVAALRFFGCWEAALAGSGIQADPSAPPPRTYPDRDSVTTAIRRRLAAGLPLNRTAVERGGTANTALAGSAVLFFGGWDEALAAAGLEPRNHQICRKCGYTTREKVREAIQARARRGEGLTATALSKGERRDARLYGAGRKLFGSWPAALEAAGIDPSVCRAWKRK